MMSTTMARSHRASLIIYEIVIIINGQIHIANLFWTIPSTMCLSRRISLFRQDSFAERGSNYTETSNLINPGIAYDRSRNLIFKIDVDSVMDACAEECWYCCSKRRENRDRAVTSDTSYCPIREVVLQLRHIDRSLTSRGISIKEVCPQKRSFLVGMLQVQRVHPQMR